jgi:hypothetical protein
MPKDLKLVRDQIAASNKKEEKEARENQEGKPEPPKKERVINKYQREF